MRKKKYLTISEKQELLLNGKRIPICAYIIPKEEKKRKKEKEKLASKFAKNTGI